MFEVSSIDELRIRDDKGNDMLTYKMLLPLVRSRREDPTVHAARDLARGLHVRVVLDGFSKSYVLEPLANSKYTPLKETLAHDSIRSW